MHSWRADFCASAELLVDTSTVLTPGCVDVDQLTATYQRSTHVSGMVGVNTRVRGVMEHRIVPTGQTNAPTVVSNFFLPSINHTCLLLFYLFVLLAANFNGFINAKNGLQTVVL